jgi:hypothetical protein
MAPNLVVNHPTLQAPNLGGAMAPNLVVNHPTLQAPNLGGAMAPNLVVNHPTLQAPNLGGAMAPNLVVNHPTLRAPNLGGAMAPNLVVNHPTLYSPTITGSPTPPAVTNTGSADTGTSPASSMTFHWVSTPAAGEYDWIAVFVSSGMTAATPSGWTPGQTLATGTFRLQTFYIENGASAASFTISTVSGSAQMKALGLGWSGIKTSSSIDQLANALQSSSLTLTSPTSGTLAQASEISQCAFGWTQTSGVLLVTGNGYQDGGHSYPTFNERLGLAVSWKVLSSTAATSTTTTISVAPTGSYCAFLEEFKGL